MITYTATYSKVHPDGRWEELANTINRVSFHPTDGARRELEAMRAHILDYCHSVHQAEVVESTPVCVCRNTSFLSWDGSWTVWAYRVQLVEEEADATAS